MKISLQWLQEFVDLEETPQQLAEDLTMAGLEVEGIAEVDGDTIFEIGVTPNRPDWLSHLGVSRELAALYGREVRVPE
ncbi:MAG TPA: phenylalanine--tRNA ligase subunit beta, partial [Proteobacteria bacterium]|nr:phenylalanine--tRNA ligase subunit beta [Pseudomonadota bacterium]